MRTNKTNRPARYALSLAALACLALIAAGAPDADQPGQTAPQAGEESAARAAAEIVRQSGAPGGIIGVVGAEDAELAMALAGQRRFVVQCLADTQDACDRLRRAIRSRGVYGTVSADVLDGPRLPYTDNLLNLVVVGSYPSLAARGFSPAEVFRVLAPLGTACFGGPAAAGPGWTEELAGRLRAAGFDDVSLFEAGGTWVRAQKPWPADIDQWTHYLHGADGNPVARDLVVGPPRHYQWISDPPWQRSHETDSSLSTLVTASGRLFAIIDEAPTSLAGDNSLPDKWSLVARDAFNGVLLWKVPIEHWGWREWKSSWFNTRPGDIPLNIQKRLVAVGDRVYVTLGYRAPVSELDARTGKILKTYAGTERTGEILWLDGTLILSVLDGDRVRVMAVDAASGKTLWKTAGAYRGSTTDYIRWKEMNGGIEPAVLDSSLNVAAAGDTVALIDGPDVVGLDLATGREKWHTRFPQDEADLTAGRIDSGGNLWIGTMIVADGVVLHASPNRLGALSAETGEVLWTQPKKYIGHLWYEWKDVFVIGGLVWTWSDELVADVFDLGGRKQRTLAPKSVKGYDLKTGELKKEVPLGSTFKANHHHRCYRNKATLRYILASRRGSEYVDLENGRHTIDNWVRGTCHVGMMPANGLQYAPPHPCQCYIAEKLNGMNALAAERKADGAPASSGDERPRLTRGPAYGQPAPPLAAGPALAESWPAFRHDAMRSGAVDTRVPADAAILWRVRAGRRVSPPIVVGDRLFAALIDEHQVVCLDVRDGRTLWEFAAGGRIDSPPTYHEGTVLFGSADGRVYCLRASDGQLVWRFRAAPEQRLIGAFGQLESAWPVHGSVLVEQGVVYFAAGRSSQLDGGIYLYGLDAAAGKKLHETRLEGPHYGVDSFEVNFQLPMGALPDVLASDGAAIYMRSLAFDADLKPRAGSPALEPKSGYLDDSYFKRTPWTLGGQYARLIVNDATSAYYVRMFDTLRGLDPTVFFTPGDKGYLLFARRTGQKADAWAERIRVRVRAMVLAGDRLVVAGPPDVVDPKDPLGAFEGRKGGLLRVIDAATGEELAGRELPSPPVFNGAAAACGRLYVVDEAGNIACFGSPQSGQ